ncbi:Metastasis suppressor protein 1 [Collichthys lucidus]|uniref:Metastasis suppressor protein 1 n=1 Tax=Collichthys lucidus TaxID=240159 RepID=A0A4U5VMI1_COLLU|nr:Metastasis suppressor protein 1 [Collichthys lucidus]
MPRYPSKPEPQSQMPRYPSKPEPQSQMPRYPSKPEPQSQMPRYPSKPVPLPQQPSYGLTQSKAGMFDLTPRGALPDRVSPVQQPVKELSSLRKVEHASPPADMGFLTAGSAAACFLNGFDHHAALCLHGAALQQPQDIHLHPPYFTYSTTTSPISSPTYSSVSPTWPWSRSGSGQSGELFPPLSPSGLGLIPSSRVPSWKDWAKPGPYEQSMVNTLKRSKDRRETSDTSSHQGAEVTTPGEEPQGVKGISDCDYYSVGADQEGEHQQSSSDFDKSSTIPRNSDISQSYRRMFQSKRPASTAGLPSNPSAVITPGVATIRRTPSSKPNLRRPSGGLSLGPIPIKPPMIPVKTPTVPEHPGFPSRASSEDGNTPRTPLSPPTTPLSPGSSGPLSVKSGSCESQHLGEGSDPPTPPPQPSGRVSEWERRPLPELLEETEYGEVEDFLVAIRRGVRLKRAMTNDRSAPSIH